MHIWSPVNGDIEIIVESLLPCEFEAELRLLRQGAPDQVFPGIVHQVGGPVHFHVADAAVQAAKGNAWLMLATTCTRVPGSPVEEWGYRYTIAPPVGNPPTENGAPVALNEGYFESPLQQYPNTNPPSGLGIKAIKFQ